MLPPLGLLAVACTHNFSIIWNGIKAIRFIPSSEKAKCEKTNQTDNALNGENKHNNK